MKWFSKIAIFSLLGTPLFGLSPEQQVYSGGVDLRVGKNSLSQKLLGANSIFVYSETNSTTFSEPEVSYGFSLIRNGSELRSELDIFGSKSLSVGNFLSSKEGQFYENFEMDRNKVYLLIKKEIVTKTDEISDANLTAEGNTLYQNNFKEFKNLYGDLFVSKIYYGDREFSLFEIDTYSPQEKSNIEIYLENLEAVFSEEDFTSRIATLETKFRDTSRVKYREILDTSEPFLVRFTPDSNIDGIEQIPEEEEKDQILKEYIVRDQEYGDIISKVNYSQTVSEKGLDFFNEIYKSAGEDLENLKLETEREQSRIKGFARNCKKGDGCVALSSFDGREYLEFSNYSDLNSRVPEEFNRITLNSCAEHQNYFFQDFRDSNYTIEISENGTEHNVSLYCLDMETSSPIEYLPLSNSSYAETPDGNFSFQYLKFDLSNTKVFLEVLPEVEVDEVLNLKVDFTNSEMEISSVKIEINNNSSKGYFIHKEIPTGATNQITSFENETNANFTSINSAFLEELDYKIFKDSSERLSLQNSSTAVEFKTNYGLGEQILNNGEIELNVK
jgi:hypothetical protein